MKNRDRLIDRFIGSDIHHINDHSSVNATTLIRTHEFGVFKLILIHIEESNSNIVCINGFRL